MQTSGNREHSSADSSTGGRTMVAAVFADPVAARRAVDELGAAGLGDCELEQMSPGRTLVTVVSGVRSSEALTILERCGGETGARRSQPAAAALAGQETEKSVRPAASDARSQRTRIALHGEVLHVRKERVQTEEVRVRKEVITEMRTIQVPVRREELVVERVPKGDSSQPPVPEEVLRIPLVEEQIVIEKHPTVIEEVFIEKRQIEHVQRLQVPLKREQLNVDFEGTGGD